MLFRSLSPEAPLPVVDVKEVVNKPGGAGNVVANLKGFGCEAMTIMPPGHFPVKNRLISNGHQIARWDQDDFVEMYTVDILRRSKSTFDKADAIIISDYAKGALTAASIQIIAELGHKKPFFIDSKRCPSLYKDLNGTFFPNLKEFFQFPEYVKQAQVLRKESADGMTYFINGEPVHHEPAFSANPLSVSGAGDTVVAAFAYASCKGGAVQNNMVFASKAAAIAIGKPLTSIATLDEIEAFS